MEPSPELPAGPPQRRAATNPSFAESRLSFGRYRLLKAIGRGGQGSVWLAEDPALGRTVALKILDPTVALAGPEDESLQRFEREARVAARLEHPAICPIYDAGQLEGRPYIAMRALDGMSLAEAIAGAGQPDGESSAAGSEGESESFVVGLSSAWEASRGQPDSFGGTATAAAGGRATAARVAARSAAAEDQPLASVPEQAPLSKARKRSHASSEALQAWLKRFETLGAALAFAHEKGVVHRDIKPANIMLLPDGEPMLLDFGLAGLLDEAEAGLTQSGDRFGTPAYMSPEQVRGERVGPATDVYSLGATLYEVLTGHRPFEARDRDSLFHAIQHEAPSSPRGFDASLPADLAIVLEKALEKDPERRYASVSDFAADLARVRRREPIKARRVPRRVHATRWVQRHALLSAATAVVFTLLVAWLLTTRHLLAETRFALADSRRSEAEADRAREESDAARLRAESARSEAEAARVDADESSAFFRGILASANPNVMGHRVSVLEVVEQGAKRLPLDYAHRPRVRAQLETSISEVFGSLGRHAEARELLESGLRNLERARELESPGAGARLDIVEAGLRLRRALHFREVGRMADAVPEARECLALLGPDTGERTLNRAIAHGVLARAAYESGDHDEMLRHSSLQVSLARGQGEGTTFRVREVTALTEHAMMLRTALGEAERSWAALERAAAMAEDPALATQRILVLMERAQWLSHFGRSQETLPMLEEALLLARGHWPKGSTTVADGAWRLGMAHIERRRPDLARPYFAEALEIRERILGEEHRDVATAQSSLASALLGLGLVAEAEAGMRRAMAIRTAIYSAEHVSVASSHQALANLFSRTGRLEEAEKHLRLAYAGKRRHYGEEHPDPLGALTVLAILLQNRGDFEEAERSFRKVIEGRAKHDARAGPTPHSVRDYANLAGLLFRRERVAEAREAMEHAIGMEAAAGVRPGSGVQVLTRRGIATLMERQDPPDLDGARRALEELFEAQCGLETPALVPLLGCAAHLARVCRESDDPAGALEVAERALMLAEAPSAQLDEARNRVALERAHALRALGRSEPAEELFVSLYELERAAERLKRARQIAAIVAEMRRAAGDVPAAEVWRERERED